MAQNECCFFACLVNVTCLFPLLFMAIKETCKWQSHLVFQLQTKLLLIQIIELTKTSCLSVDSVKKVVIEICTCKWQMWFTTPVIFLWISLFTTWKFQPGCRLKVCYLFLSILKLLVSILFWSNIKCLPGCLETAHFVCLINISPKYTCFMNSVVWKLKWSIIAMIINMLNQTRLRTQFIAWSIHSSAHLPSEMLKCSPILENLRSTLRCSPFNTTLNLSSLNYSD